MSKQIEIFLSGLVVAHNEEEAIEDALKSLDFCDEVVVLLDKCTDNTKKIAKKYTNNIIEGSWEIEGERRAVAINACKGKWIFECDADERVEKPLAQAILEKIKTSPNGYVNIPVQNYVGDHYIEHGWAGSFGTSRAKKLFSKGAKIWGMERVHPAITLNGKEMEFDRTFAKGEGLTHLVDKDINDMINRMQRYSDAIAKDWRDKNHMPKFSNSLRRAFTRFYKSYFARKGYKEGRYGFLIALMAFLMIIFTHIKAELER